MQFRTSIKIKSLNQKINHTDKILLLGSCFSEHIGNKLVKAKFDVLSNPFGVIFNPISIFDLLNKNLKPNFFDDNYIQNKGIWYNYQVHSKISNPNLEALKKNTLQVYQSSQKYLSKSKWIILTFGTAFIYHRTDIESQNLVANCHRMPANLFEKKLLTVEEIVRNFVNFYSQLTNNQQVILTISPVRHIKDTLTLNTVSKSTLHLAAYRVSQKYQNVYYFPSYELMLDDLRDYRFFKSDMIHPNEQAIEYIWEAFQNFAFDEQTQKFILEWNKISQAMEHRAFHPQSEEHQKFLQNLLKKVQGFKNINISQEIQMIEQQLTLL